MSVLADSVDIESGDRRGGPAAEGGEEEADRDRDHGMRACPLQRGRDCASVAAPAEQTGDLTLPQMTVMGWRVSGWQWQEDLDEVHTMSGLG